MSCGHQRNSNGPWTCGIDAESTILLCATELCSLHYHFAWDPERMMGNALFADGSAAIVCRQASTTCGDHWSIAATGSCLIPDSTDAMTWKVGDHGFEMSLSARVPDLIEQHLRAWLEGWLRKSGYQLSDINAWAIHPGGPRIISAVENGLDLPAGSTAISREILHDFGNMSSPTVLFILERMRQKKISGPCVVLGFGPGLIAEAGAFILMGGFVLVALNRRSLTCVLG